MTTKVTIQHDAHNSAMDVMVLSINPMDGKVFKETRVLEHEVFEGYVHSTSKFEVVEVPKLPKQ